MSRESTELLAIKLNPFCTDEDIIELRLMIARTIGKSANDVNHQDRADKISKIIIDWYNKCIM